MFKCHLYLLFCEFTEHLFCPFSLLIVVLFLNALPRCSLCISFFGLCYIFQICFLFWHLFFDFAYSNFFQCRSFGGVNFCCCCCYYYLTSILCKYSAVDRVVVSQEMNHFSYEIVMNEVVFQQRGSLTHHNSTDSYKFGDFRKHCSFCVILFPFILGIL